MDNSKIVDGSEIQVGHQMIGIASSGLHSNGYSLVRKICFDVLKMDVHTHVAELGQTLGEALLTPTRIYSETVQHLIRGLPVRGLAHITGGGIVNNVLRIIPKACGIVLKRGSWETPPIFDFLQGAGNVENNEMMRVFNNGVGMVAVVPEDAAQDVLSSLTAMKEKAWVIGRSSSAPAETTPAFSGFEPSEGLHDTTPLKFFLAVLSVGGQGSGKTAPLPLLRSPQSGCRDGTQTTQVDQRLSFAGHPSQRLMSCEFSV